MARQRFIWPALWVSEQVGNLSHGARLLFIGIFSLADDEGRIKASEKYLKVQIFPYDKEKNLAVSEWKKELEGLVQFYSVGGEEYASLPTWKKYQRPKYPSPSSIPEPTAATICEKFPQASGNVPPVLPESSGNVPPVLPESSGNVPPRDGLGRDGLGKGRIEPPLPPKGEVARVEKTEFPEESIPYRLAKLLLNLILQRRPTFKEPDLQAWAAGMDAITRIDKRVSKEVAAVIRWVQSDTADKHPGEKWTGWANNILSPDKLRAKYDKICLRMDEGLSRAGQPQDDFEDRCARAAKADEVRMAHQRKIDAERQQQELALEAEGAND